MKTMKLFTSQITPGMVVAEDVYTFNNQLIIAAGTVITDKLITRLNFYSVNALTVSLPEEEKEKTKESEQPVQPEVSMSDYIRKSPEFQYYKTAMPVAMNQLKNQIHAITETQREVDTDALLENVHTLIKHARNGIHVFDMLHCLRDYNDQTFAHSLNVALICYTFGMWLEYSSADIEILTLSGLLHDIGKVTIPPNIILKPSRLTQTEFETIKTHTIRGYNILRPKNIDTRIKMAAMMHHERCDGSGYPMGLRADQIDPFAKIVAIADVYEAMTSARVYRGPICPFEVIQLMESEGLAKYDPHFLMTFLEHLNLTYINNSVRLSNKAEGKIVMMNRYALSKPIVKVGRKYIDLSYETNLHIEQIL